MDIAASKDRLIAEVERCWEREKRLRKLCGEAAWCIEYNLPGRGLIIRLRAAAEAGR